MRRLFGILKVTAILALDFFAVYSLFEDIRIAAAVAGVIALYVMFGGYIALLKDGAVNMKKLPVYQRTRLEMSKNQLTDDVKNESGASISGLRLYYIPEDDEMNAYAYGFNCVSVTRGTFNNTDPITLNGVLAHEVSHILNCDAEVNRAVFASVLLLVGAISVASFIAVAIVFAVCLALSCFRSWLGAIIFQGTKKGVSGFFDLLQRGVVMIYRIFTGITSRHAEYRSDRYACKLGYGLQLSHFLAITESAGGNPLTLTEAMYRSHPPTPKRIARLERQLLKQNRAVTVNR